jgi:transposase InsO family protein
VSESWFSTLKEELIYRVVLPTRAVAQRAIFEYVEILFYNRVRRHSSFSNISPAEYERRRADLALSQAQAA